MNKMVSMVTLRSKNLKLVARHFPFVVSMNVAVEKCGIQVKPPAFVVIYRAASKLRKKTMPLRNFKSSSNVDFVASDIRKRHNLEEVPLVKIEKLLRLLQELMKGVDMSEATEKIKNEFEIKLDEDLNKMSTREIEIQKQLMDSLFFKNQIKKDDENFIYDKRLDFDDEKEESNWDLEGDDDNFWD